MRLFLQTHVCSLSIFYECTPKLEIAVGHNILRNNVGRGKTLLKNEVGQLQKEPKST